MKILHLIDSGGLYGAEMMLLSLAKQQIKNGMEPTIGSIRIPDIAYKAIEEEAVKLGIELHLFNMKSGFNLSGSVDILKYAKNNNFDVIHSHGYKPNILLGLIPKSIRKIPIISTKHGYTSTVKFSKMHVYQLLDTFALKFVDRIVLVSRAMLESNEINNLPTDKIELIENGIDITHPEMIYEDQNKIINSHIEDDTIRHSLRKFCDDSLLLTSIGRLSAEKGYDVLIQAVSILINEHHLKIKLLLIGDGIEKDNLLRLANELGIAENLFITGYIDNAKFLLPLADIYVISSHTEGLPITLLEAMSFSIPIIATKVGGIPYVIDNEREGLLVESAKPSEIADAVLRITKDKNLANGLIFNSASKLRSMFTSEVMAEKYTRVYNQVSTSLPD
ncbi:MAG: glycosyltransferase [Candidatus Thiodiazotropha sp.]